MTRPQVLYLNFQKPPPTSIKAAEPLRFSARISNDLKELDYWPSKDSGEVLLEWYWVVFSEEASPASPSLKGKEPERARQPLLKRIGAQRTISTWQGPSSAYQVIELAAPTEQELKGLTEIRLAGSSIQDTDTSQGRARDGSDTATQQRKNKRAKVSSREAFESSDQLPSRLIFPIARLGASGSGSASSEASQEEIILPVLSDVIEVESTGTSGESGSKAVSKLSHTSRLLRLSGDPVLRNVALHVVEQSGFDLDKHIWDAALFALRLLQDGLLQAHDSTSSSRKAADRSLCETLRQAIAPMNKASDDPSSASFNIVELGSGTSLVLVGLLAMLKEMRIVTGRGEASLLPRVNAVATDLESALPIIKLNLQANSFSPESGESGISVTAVPLDWEDATPPTNLFGHGGDSGPNLVLVSDCTYNPSYFKPLCQTIARLLRLAGRTHTEPVCLLTKKHRHEEEERLWAEVREAGLMEVLIEGAQGWERGEEAGTFLETEVEGQFGAWLIRLT